MDKPSRQLLRFQRQNILEFGGSASDTTDTEAELLTMQKLAGNKKFIKMFEGWAPKNLFEKKLVLGILHRRNHKDVVEQDYKSADEPSFFKSLPKLPDVNRLGLP